MHMSNISQDGKIEDNATDDALMATRMEIPFLTNRHTGANGERSFI